MAKEKMETIELLLDIDVHKTLTKMAEKEKITFDELVTKILREEIEKEKKGQDAKTE